MTNYIINSKDSYDVVYGGHKFARCFTKKEAVLIQSLLKEIKWDESRLESISGIYELEGKFLIVYAKNVKVHVLSRYDSKLKAEKNFNRDVDNFIHNPHSSMYGIFISGNNSSYSVNKSTEDIQKYFEDYRKYEDAVFVKNILEENNWNVENLNRICYDKTSGTFKIILTENNAIRVLDTFDSYHEAEYNRSYNLHAHRNNSFLKNDKSYIMENNNLFSIYRNIRDKKIYYGSFRLIEDARATMNILQNHNWNLNAINLNRIYKIGDYHWVFYLPENYLKVIGKYDSFKDSCLEENNRSLYCADDFNKKDINDDRFVYPRKDGGYVIIKKIQGAQVSFGNYDSITAARDARNEFENEGWNYYIDDDSIFGDEYDNSFEKLLHNLSRWQKIIFDAICDIGKEEFSFDEVKNNSYISRYNLKNLDKKLDKHLNELVDSNLIKKVDENKYKRLWN